MFAQVRRIWRLATILLVVATGLAAPAAVRAERWQPAAWNAPAPPAVTAKAAYVFDATAGVPLFALNPDEPLPPASLTKIATAMVVLERADLDATVEILPSDVVDETQSRVGLVAGDRLPVRDLFVGLLVPSGNDAALALARTVGAGLPGGEQDPIAAFVAEMNRWAAAQGAATTTFRNPTGMPAEGQHSSARDLSVMAAAAMADPLFAETVATQRAVLPSAVRPEGYEIFTTNDMLLDGTAIGVKTGTLPEAGGCVTIATRIAGNLVVSTVLGSELSYDEAGNFSSPARFVDTRTLLAAAEDGYEWIDPAAPGAVPGLVEELAAWNAALPPATVPVPRDRGAALSYRLRLEAAAEPGDRVGSVLLLVGSDVLAERPLEQAGAALAAAG